MAGMCNPDPGPDPVPDPEPEPDLEQPYEVSFAAKVNEMTTRATDTAFEDGDEISVYACYDASLSSSNYAQNVRYKYDKGLFESTYPISYPDKSALPSMHCILTAIIRPRKCVSPYQRIRILKRLTWKAIL